MEKIARGNAPLGFGQFDVSVGDRSYRLAVLDDRHIEIDGQVCDYSIRQTGPGTYSLILDASGFEIAAVAGNGRSDAAQTELLVNGVSVALTVDDRRSQLRKGMLQGSSRSSGTQIIRAPMPGKVVRVEVKPGDHVGPGTGLIILEAMKMENEIKSTGTGIVERVQVEQGKAVEKDELLISIRPE